LGLLKQCRLNALLAASCQRIAYTCYQVAQPSSISQADMGMRFLNHVVPQFAPCFDPCPWLKESRELGMPFYLWDVQEKKTKEVNAIRRELGVFPEYVAVSHTWGRWKMKDEPWISLAGVPWRIPQNQRFKVQDLPEILQGLWCSYVWMDLLTIPQIGDQENSAMIKLQKDEVS